MWFNAVKFSLLYQQVFNPVDCIKQQSLLRARIWRFVDRWLRRVVNFTAFRYFGGKFSPFYWLMFTSFICFLTNCVTFHTFSCRLVHPCLGLAVLAGEQQRPITKLWKIKSSKAVQVPHESYQPFLSSHTSTV